MKAGATFDTLEIQKFFKQSLTFRNIFKKKKKSFVIS